MLKRTLEGSMFANPVKMITEMNTILTKISFDRFFKVFDEWKCKLREFINRGDEDLETDRLSSLDLVHVTKFSSRKAFFACSIDA
jgi:hypothetical protein